MSGQELVKLIASAERLLGRPYRCPGQDGPGWGEGWGEGDDPDVCLQSQKEFWREAYVAAALALVSAVAAERAACAAVARSHGYAASDAATDLLAACEADAIADAIERRGEE